MARAKNKNSSAPLAVCNFNLIEAFWDYLRENGVKTVFITAEVESPLGEMRPSRFGAFYAVLTALVKEPPPAHLAQYVAPLVGIDQLDDFADRDGTTQRIKSQMQSFRDTAEEMEIATIDGRWRSF